MSERVKCFEVVSSAVEEADKKFGPLWQINEENYDILREYCGAIDQISDESAGVFFNVDVHDRIKTVSIKLGCHTMLLENMLHVYYSLILRAVKFGFSATDDGFLVLEFEFPSVWNRIQE